MVSIGLCAWELVELWVCLNRKKGEFEANSNLKSLALWTNNFLIVCVLFLFKKLLLYHAMVI